MLYLPGRECSRTGSSDHPCPQSTCGRTIQGWHQPPPKQLISWALLLQYLTCSILWAFSSWTVYFMRSLLLDSLFHELISYLTFCISWALSSWKFISSIRLLCNMLHFMRSLLLDSLFHELISYLESLVSRIPAGNEKLANLFLQCTMLHFKSLFIQLVSYVTSSILWVIVSQQLSAHSPNHWL